MTMGDENGLLDHMQSMPASTLMPRTQAKDNQSAYGKHISLSGPSGASSPQKLDVRGLPKVSYKEGQRVAFDLGCGTKGTGRIRGLVIENVIDFWIVEVENAEGIDASMYPWTCISIPHTLFTPIA